jgi:predicted RNA-binding Zn-ribbon protein involved in translation (DUF1610 family)
MASKRRKKIDRCTVCGTKATHKVFSVPLCGNILCDVVRQETIKDELMKDSLEPAAKEFK